ncbi:MAG: CsbD family protein [Litorilinea sp.]
MNSDVIKGQWNQLKGEVKQKWGKLTDDDITQIEGSYDKLVGRIQERYGYARERAEQEANRFFEGRNA